MQILPNDLTNMIPTRVDGLVMTHVPWPEGEERIKMGLIKDYIPVGSIALDTLTGDMYYWTGERWDRPHTEAV